jgi:hypothetical protein
LIVLALADLETSAAAAEARVRVLLVEGASPSSSSSSSAAMSRVVAAFGPSFLRSIVGQHSGAGSTTHRFLFAAGDLPGLMMMEASSSSPLKTVSNSLTLAATAPGLARDLRGSLVAVPFEVEAAGAAADRRVDLRVLRAGVSSFAGDATVDAGTVSASLIAPDSASTSITS